MFDGDLDRLLNIRLIGTKLVITHLIHTSLMSAHQSSEWNRFLDLCFTSSQKNVSSTLCSHCTFLLKITSIFCVFLTWNLLKPKRELFLKYEIMREKNWYHSVSAGCGSDSVVEIQNRAGLYLRLNANFHFFTIAVFHSFFQIFTQRSISELVD